MLFFQLPVVPPLLLSMGHGAGVTRLLRSAAIDKTNFGREELAPIAAAVTKPGRPAAMIGWYRAAFRASLRGGLGGPAHLRAYEKVTVPTLLLWGMEDTALGYHDLVPGTEQFALDLEIQTLPACGHFVQSEQPQEVNRRLLQFLARPAPASA